MATMFFELFVLVSTLYDEGYPVVPGVPNPTSKAFCAVGCSRNDECGGYFWNGDQVDIISNTIANTFTNKSSSIYIIIIIHLSSVGMLPSTATCLVTKSFSIRTIKSTEG